MKVRVPHELTNQLREISASWGHSVVDIVRKSLRSYAGPSGKGVELSDWLQTSTRNGSEQQNWAVETELEGWEVVAVVAWNLDRTLKSMPKYKHFVPPTDVEYVVKEVE